MDKKIQKEFAQYLTNSTVATYMAKLFSASQTKLSILDPGAGEGILGISLLSNLAESIDNATFVEIEENIFKKLSKNLEANQFDKSKINKINKDFVELALLWRITQAQYDKMRSKWRSLQEGYEAKLQKIMKADEEYYITASYLLELASRSYELFMGSEPEQKRQLVTLVFQNLRMKDGKLSYEWVKPFDSIFVSAKSNKWGRLWREIRNAMMTHYLNLAI